LTAPRRFAFIGNSLPRRCGIATFTTDLQQAIAASLPQSQSAIVAMTDTGRHYDYPPAVSRQIDDQNLDDYARAAGFLNAGGFEVVCLQHEFGIFGGESGSHILTLLSGLTMPIVTTLHTVLAEPSPTQRRVLSRIAAVSTAVIVMAEKGRDLLQSEYAVPAAKIKVIPHGIPDSAFVEPDTVKARRGFNGRSVILTFGLLSPNKGIESMIEAMQARLERMPKAMRIRRATVEHVFGTLKAWMGATHFQTRTLEKVRTEMSLHVLAYNLKRVIAILGVQPLMAAMRA